MTAAAAVVRLSVAECSRRCSDDFGAPHNNSGAFLLPRCSQAAFLVRNRHADHAGGLGPQQLSTELCALPEETRPAPRKPMPAWPPALFHAVYGYLIRFSGASRRQLNGHGDWQGRKPLLTGAAPNLGFPGCERAQQSPLTARSDTQRVHTATGLHWRQAARQRRRLAAGRCSAAMAELEEDPLQALLHRLSQQATAIPLQGVTGMLGTSSAGAKRLCETLARRCLGSSAPEPSWPPLPCGCRG